MNKKIFLYSLLCLLIFSACQSNKKSKPSVSAKPLPKIEFSADSAYRYIAEQVAFGPRTPGSKAHQDCGDYLYTKMQSFGAQVQEQKADITTWDGKTFPMRNIIASYLPEKQERVLLFAHWDCRPWSDMESDAKERMKAVLGANDGASGVGVLMEIARQLGKQNQLPIGVDIIFFDLEDYGVPDWERDVKNSWCLGSQYWAKHPHKNAYNARYGILLDMVGTKNACFMWELFSKHYASQALYKVWNQAQTLGYGQYFIQGDGGVLTDDHLYINTLAGIPSIDIIDYDESRGGFFEGWHTQHDDMRHIDKATLQAVGHTVLSVLYSE